MPKLIHTTMSYSPNVQFTVNHDGVLVMHVNDDRWTQAVPIDDPEKFKALVEKVTNTSLNRQQKAKGERK